MRLSLEKNLHRLTCCSWAWPTAWPSPLESPRSLRISGAHINPAVTIAAVATGNACAARGVIYIVFQLAGAAAASAFMRIVSDVPNLGVHHVNPAHLSTATGFGVEVVLTFILVLVVFATAVDPRASRSLAPFAIGAVVALNSFVALPLTGASHESSQEFWAGIRPLLVGPALDLLDRAYRGSGCRRGHVHAVIRHRGNEAPYEVVVALEHDRAGFGKFTRNQVTLPRGR